MHFKHVIIISLLTMKIKYNFSPQGKTLPYNIFVISRKDGSPKIHKMDLLCRFIVPKFELIN